MGRVTSAAPAPSSPHGRRRPHLRQHAECEAVQAQFDALDIVELSVAIAQINAWNRLGVGKHLPVLVKPMP